MPFDDKEGRVPLVIFCKYLRGTVESLTLVVQGRGSGKFAFFSFEEAGRVCNYKCPSVNCLNMTLRLNYRMRHFLCGVY